MKVSNISFFCFDKDNNVVKENVFEKEFEKELKIEVETKQYYTFKRSEHEFILLKKLDDNKIIYNNTIYDKDFFHYHKLELFISKIYELRNDYINKSILLYYEYLSQLKGTGMLRTFKVIHEEERDEWINLTEVQYSILLKAYKYEFPYMLKYNLFFHDTHDELMNEEDEEEIIDYPPINTFFKEWFYILGWRSIKPVYPTFEQSLYFHYDDEYRNEDRFRLEYPFWDQGTKTKFPKEFSKDWFIEYDEQKKFSEYDIYCTTNTYHARYKVYNEIYYKDYPEEKKFKTDLIHDFTEEEIKENYENMIDKEKTALEKYNFVLLNLKRKTVVEEFFEELEVIEATNKKINYVNYYFEDQDNDDVLGRKIVTALYYLLNDPRYLLVKPLVDAYFEFYRPKGWYGQDESFLQPTPYETTEKKYFRYLNYFDMSYEKVYELMTNYTLNDIFLDVEYEEFDEEFEDMFWILGVTFLTILWFCGISTYMLLYCHIYPTVPFMTGRVSDVYFAALEDYFKFNNYYNTKYNWRNSVHIKPVLKDHFLMFEKFKRTTRKGDHYRFKVKPSLRKYAKLFENIIHKEPRTRVKFRKHYTKIKSPDFPYRILGYKRTLVWPKNLKQPKFLPYKIYDSMVGEQKKYYHTDLRFKRRGRSFYYQRLGVFDFCSNVLNDENGKYYKGRYNPTFKWDKDLREYGKSRNFHRWKIPYVERDPENSEDTLRNRFYKRVRQFITFIGKIIMGIISLIFDVIIPKLIDWFIKYILPYLKIMVAWLNEKTGFGARCNEFYNKYYLIYRDWFYKEYYLVCKDWLYVKYLILKTWLNGKGITLENTYYKYVYVKDWVRYIYGTIKNWFYGNYLVYRGWVQYIKSLYRSIKLSIKTWFSNLYNSMYYNLDRAIISFDRFLARIWDSIKNWIKDLFSGKKKEN